MSRGKNGENFRKQLGQIELFEHITRKQSNSIFDLSPVERLIIGLLKSEAMTPRQLMDCLASEPYNILISGGILAGLLKFFYRRGLIKISEFRTASRDAFDVDIFFAAV